MTDFSKVVAGCIADWSRAAADCNGGMECLEYSAKQLRECLNSAFHDSKKVDFNGDKVNYILSSIFFLANRLSKTSQGLAEFDRIMDGIEKVR